MFRLGEKLKQAREEVKLQFKEIETVQKRTELTLQGASDAIITFDQNGVVKFFNKAAAELWGIEKDGIVGRNITKLFPDEKYEDEFIKSLLDPKAEKIVGERKEIDIKNSSGEDVSVIIILSMARIEDETSYTAFIQNISVDFF